MQKTLRIKNDIHELSMMNQFLEEAGEELGLSTAFMMSLNLVMEEAVSNIIFYAYKGDVEDAVDISLVREGGELIVTLIDHGIAFDPTLRKDPDITLSAEDRPIGGLGIFLIKKIMDEVSYQSRGAECLYHEEKNNRIKYKDMEVVIDQKGEETVIKIKGRLDTNTARECEEKVLPVWENPGVKVCVDCSDLEYVSSAGLRLFLILQKMTTAKKGSLRLIGMRNVVRETFSLTGFNALFKIEDAK